MSRILKKNICVLINSNNHQFYSCLSHESKGEIIGAKDY